jgi:elongation factor G
VIDTPGHVDFTIEVERALRVLDGAVLVLCGVGGVQSQSITVDRQMKRYGVPRVAFINKLDRSGADPYRVHAQLREKLRLNAVLVQIAMGVEAEMQGVVDLIDMEAVYNRGPMGEVIERGPIPEEFRAEAEARRAELVEALADVDEQVGERFLADEEPTAAELRAGLRRATVALEIVPVFLGTALKNKGVQTLLDGVVEYLPNPNEVNNFGLQVDRESGTETKVEIVNSSELPLLALAFKLEDGKFGQLTYIRVYQGTLRKGDTIYNTSGGGRKVKVPRVVRMHANEMEDLTEIKAGEICAIFGVDCSTGDTFTDGTLRDITMESMFVPDPVVSLSITPKSRDSTETLQRALARFQKEDPTFRVAFDDEAKQTVVSGMGELHLFIYAERLKREYNVEVVTGAPYVRFREAVTETASFDYTHKKQSGGSGQWGRVIGRIEPLEDPSQPMEFSNEMIGNAIPHQFIGSVEKGFREACERGTLTGHPILGVRVVLTDGASHAVDSNDLAFRTAARSAFRVAFDKASPTVLEPVMQVEIHVPSEFQGAVMSGINQRKGTIVNSENRDDYTLIEAEVPLAAMFGYATFLRSTTQGKGEFSMDYARHARAAHHVIAELKEKWEKKRQGIQEDD